jgi:hypothetical protein
MEKIDRNGTILKGGTLGTPRNLHKRSDKSVLYVETFIYLNKTHLYI